MARQLAARVFYFKAGTPEEAEQRRDPMFRYLVENQIPTQEQFERDYRQVAAFPVPEEDRVHPEDHLDRIYADLQNGWLGTPERQKMLRDLEVGHTSMSVGDVVIFGYNALGPGPFEQVSAHIVSSVGFTKIEVRAPT